MAGCNNQGIQLFHPGKLNGQTVVGEGSSDITTVLYGLVAAALDAEKNISLLWTMELNVFLDQDQMGFDV